MSHSHLDTFFNQRRASRSRRAAGLLPALAIVAAAVVVTLLWPEKPPMDRTSASVQEVPLPSAWLLPLDGATRSGGDPSVPAASTVVFPEDPQEQAPTF
jgi:hypothetical protein